MLAATHFDNFLIPIFFAIAILFQILTRAAARGRKRPPDTRRRTITPSQMPRSISEEDQESDEERIRKFLEALGQPTTSKPPPPVIPKPIVQKAVVIREETLPTKRRSVLSPLPPLTTQPPESEPDWRSPREIRLPGQIPPIRQAKRFRPTTPDTPFEVHHGTQPLETPEPVKSPSEAYALATAPAVRVAHSKTDLATMLKSTPGLRDAIILREIFGPPRSFQPLDLVGTV